MGLFSQWMDILNGYAWGPIMILFLVGTGLFLTIRLRFVQIRRFGHAVNPHFSPL